MTPDLLPALSLVTHLGDFRWVRGHVSVFMVGAVALATVDLLTGGSRLWSLTAVGIWLLLLLVHLIVLAIVRLWQVMLAEDEEEIVLLPIQDALIVEPKRDPLSSWATATPPPAGHTDSSGSAPESVSWTVATDAAQVKRNPFKDVLE